MNNNTSSHTCDEVAKVLVLLAIIIKIIVILLIICSLISLILNSA